MKLDITNKEKEELMEAEKKTEHAKLQRRIHVIQMKAEGITNKVIEKMKGMSHDTVSKCIKKYKEGGLNLLLNRNCAGRKGRLTEEELAELKKRGEKGFTRAVEAKEYIEKKFGKKVGIRQTQRILKKRSIRTRKQVNLQGNVLQ